MGETTPRSPELHRLANSAARRAHAVFHQEGWTWGGGLDGSEGHVPSIAEIEKRILTSFDEVRPDFSIQSGRLSVWRYIDQDGEHFGVDMCIGDVEFLTPESQAMLDATFLGGLPCPGCGAEHDSECSCSLELAS